MSKTVFDAIGTIYGGVYEDIEIDGVVNIDGDVKFRKLSVDGVCNGKGSLVGEQLEIDGVCKIDGNIQVDQCEIDGVMTTFEGHIYADYIEVDGVLKNKGEVNADRMVVDGVVSLNELVGDVIELHGGANISHSLLHLLKGEKGTHQVKVIECTKLFAQSTHCGKISAQHIELSNGCVVDEIDCDGTLIYDKSCRIAKINGNCEMQINE